MKVSVAIPFLIVAPSLALWPVPKYYTNGTGVLWLSPSVDVTFNGASITPDVKKAPQQNLSASSRCDTFAQYTVQRALYTIFTDNFVPWKLHPRGSNFEPSSTSSQNYITSIQIKQTLTNATEPLKPSADGVDESYELDIDTDGKVTVSSNTSTGLIHAMSTFTQLFYQHTNNNQSVYTNLVPLTIKDSPKFQHRGLNLDVARNWYPVSSIVHTIDALAWNKFNFLHLHVTDSQSWPLQVPSIPELATKGAYTTGLSYSPQDLASIQLYGLSRGIQVVIEIDMPGHTSSIGLSYPELIAALDIQPDWSTYCAEPPCGTLKLNSSAVGNFTHKLLADVLPRLVPGSSYFHSGGDEVNVQAYLLDESVRSNSTAVIKPLLQRFIDSIHDQVRSAGLTPIVWEEMLLKWNLTLGKDVVVQTWQTDEAVANATSLGYKTLFGNSNYWVSPCIHIHPPRPVVYTVTGQYDLGNS